MRFLPKIGPYSPMLRILSEKIAQRSPTSDRHASEMAEDCDNISPGRQGLSRQFHQRTARSMETHEQQIEAKLLRRWDVDADPAQIADAVISMWQDIAAGLNPIIGKGGVDALYQRSLYLTRNAHPWLITARDPTQPAAMDLEALKSALKGQSRITAAAGGAAVLQTFHGLLSSLIGSALTERLLQPIRVNFLSEPPAQDIQP